MIYMMVDPLENLYGPLRPPLLLAKKLREELRDEVAFITPLAKIEVANFLKSQGFKLYTLNKSRYLPSSPLILEFWLRRCKFKPKDVNGIFINFSQCFLSDAHIYYAQGPIIKAIDDIIPELKLTYRLMYGLVKHLLIRRDRGFIQELRRKSKLFIANSKSCASLYRDIGIRVDDIIYPPLDCERFRPVTSKISEDFVLTYFGKETKYSVIKRIADAGVKIKAFGSKAPYIPKPLLKHPNVEFLGRVSDEELADLYSNALYTLFTFTHEPFGYIPVESMACGTPVLTYNKQGPSETVVNGVTGWLAKDDEELVELAVSYWRSGYPSWMRARCRERALKFDVKVVANRWLEVIERALSS